MIWTSQVCVPEVQIPSVIEDPQTGEAALEKMRTERKGKERKEKN